MHADLLSERRPGALPASLGNAAAFWERGRLPYTAALLLLIGGFLALQQRDSRDAAIGLAVLAMFANALYCAVYPVDLLLQLAARGRGKTVWRRFLWLAGTIIVTLASLTYFLGELECGGA